MQGSLGIVGFAAFCAMYFFFPDTSHPGSRGIDKLAADDPKRQRTIIFINPLRPLWLLRSPNLLLIVGLCDDWLLPIDSNRHRSPWFCPPR